MPTKTKDLQLDVNKIMDQFQIVIPWRSEVFVLIFRRLEFTATVKISLSLTIFFFFFVVYMDLQIRNY